MTTASLARSVCRGMLRRAPRHPPGHEHEGDTVTTKAQKIEAAKATTAALVESLHKRVAELTTGDDWKAALDFQSRFHSYSFYNTQLIWIQKPEATYILGAGAKDGSTGWKALGRHIKKGEKGIRILAPLSYKREDADGNVQSGLRGFRTVAVFDVSQTDSIENPGEPFVAPTEVLHPEELEGHAPAELIQNLVQQIADLGYTVVDDDSLLGGAKGVTIPSSKKVTVLSTASSLQRIKTLAHELAHIHLHVDNDFNYQSCRGQAEVEAESVAYVVCKSLGLDTDDYSFAYVGGWSKGDTKLVESTGKAVASVSNKVLEGVAA